jgi:hypothetical protein
MCNRYIYVWVGGWVYVCGYVCVFLSLKVKGVPWREALRGNLRNVLYCCAVLLSLACSKHAYLECSVGQNHTYVCICGLGLQYGIFSRKSHAVEHQRA